MLSAWGCQVVVLPLNSAQVFEHLLGPALLCVAYQWSNALEAKL